MISGTAPLITPLDSDLEAERRGCEPSRPVSGAPDRRALASRCEACALAATCIGRALCPAAGAGESHRGYARTVEAGQVLFHAGAVCTSIGVIETGFFKTVALAEDGVARVTGFHLSGDALGLDAFGAGIGSYLGLEVETVSRVLGRLRERLLVDVHRRHVHIRSVDALRDFMAGDASTYRRTVPRPDRGALKRGPSAGREPHRAHAARPTGSEP